MLNDVIEDCMLKAYIESDKRSINVISSNISLSSDQEECHNALKKQMVVKIKQYRNECNSKGEQEETIEENEHEDEKEDSISAEYNAFVNESEDKDDVSDMLDEYFEEIEEMQKNQDNIKLKIKVTDAMCWVGD